MCSPLLRALFSLFPCRTTSARSMSSAAAVSQLMFQLKFDPLTGKSEWVVIQEVEEEYSAKPPTTRALLTKTSYLDMLNDTRRNRVFREAIEKTFTKPCHVLDIGAGTGLLSMMAARAMNLAGPGGMVTACESYLPMIKLMRKVLRTNGMDGKIRVINKRSDELEVGMDIPSRADVLVSEILDSELLGEGLIPTLQHAYDKLLVENPETIPYRATTYGQLVECTYLWEMHDLFNKEEKATDGVHLVPSGMIDLLCVKQKQYAMHCDAIKDECKLLSEPFKVFDFDFWKRPDSSREVELQINATNDGTVHAIISWWVLQLDKEGTIFYSTGPKWIPCPSDVKELDPSFHDTENWCDHWKQSVWLFPNSGLAVSKDEEVRLHAMHNETSVSYEFRTSRQNVVEHHDLRTQDYQILLSPERNALYGDSCWRCCVLRAIHSAVCQQVSPLCLVADDSIFYAVAVAHLSKNSHVIPLFPGLGKKGVEYLQAVASVNNYSMDQIEIIKKNDLLLNLPDYLERKINLFVAEPFYFGNDSALPWENLRFWKDRCLLESILSKDVVTIPCKGLLKACVMNLPDLWRSRCSLKEIEGFDHSVVNSTLGASGDLPIGEEEIPFLPFFIWQCGETKILSEINTILELDFSKPVTTKCYGKSEIKFKESGICHGIVFWIDWVLMDDDREDSLLTTGPDKRNWKQGVKLLRKPVEVRGGSFSIQVVFQPCTGELVVHHVFS